MSNVIEVDKTWEPEQYKLARTYRGTVWMGHWARLDNYEGEFTVCVNLDSGEPYVKTRQDAAEVVERVLGSAYRVGKHIDTRYFRNHAGYPTTQKVYAVIAK